MTIRDHANVTWQEIRSYVKMPLPPPKGVLGIHLKGKRCDGRRCQLFKSSFKTVVNFEVSYNGLTGAIARSNTIVSPAFSIVFPYILLAFFFFKPNKWTEKIRRGLKAGKNATAPFFRSKGQDHGDRHTIDPIFPVCSNGVLVDPPLNSDTFHVVNIFVRLKLFANHASRSSICT